MKKLIIVMLACTFVYTLSFAQEKTETEKPKAQSFIGLTGGYSNAMGNFIKTDYADDKSGFASAAGFNMGLEGAYYFHQNIGFGGVFSSTSFYSKGLQNLSDGYKDAFAVDSTTVL